MAGGQERVLRRRIRSVQSTKKITKAMELIAASQIVRAQNRIAANRPYRAGLVHTMAAAQKETVQEEVEVAPGAATDASGAVGIVAIVGDRGLAGAYNSSVFRATERLVQETRAAGRSVHLITVGKKAPSYFRFRGIDVEQSFVGFSDRPAFGDARDVAASLWWPYQAGEIDKVLLVSTRFVSAGSQSVKVAQLLPLPELEDSDAEQTPTEAGPLGFTEFEPDPEEILAGLAPRYIESEIFSALLEGAASFFTAQQRAMAAATDNADELIRTLSRIMNRARQDAITTEIMEIVGGAEALRQSKGA